MLLMPASQLTKNDSAEKQEVINRQFRRIISLLFILAVSPGVAATAKNADAGLSGSEVSTAPHIDQQLNNIIRQHNLTGNPAKGLALPEISSPKPQLGMKLFFSKSLSGNLDVACASCHHPFLGGGDNLSLPIGINSLDDNIVGPKRRHRDLRAMLVPRNAPTTFNIALWKRMMFHDGRIEQRWDGTITTPDAPYPQADTQAGSNLVQAQARFPVTAANEMRGHSFDKDGSTQSCREALAARLGGYETHEANEAPLEKKLAGYWLDQLRAVLQDNAADSAKLLENTALTQTLGNLQRTQNNDLATDNQQYWLTQFRQAFTKPEASAQQLITEQNISIALSEYQRSQVFIETPWKKYIEGDKDAISSQAKQGALLFYKPASNGGFDCVSCHSGDFFTDENFHHTLMPPIGPGKENQAGLRRANHDAGRSLVTGKTEDNFHFRTPSLLNVEVTGPWGHNGAYTTLANAVRHMLNPYRMALNYNRLQLQQKHIPLTALQAGIDEMLTHDVDLQVHTYTEDDVQALIAFLQSLTDPCVKDRNCLADWIPDSGDNDPLKLQLRAFNSQQE
ncbi:MAG: cytochrome-c peroxidase [Thiolinea sp.]